MTERKTMLKPGETMRAKREQQRLALDADAVHAAIRSTPGIPGKNAIATVTGMSPARVALVLKRIQAGDTGHTPVEYGEVKVYGKMLKGWYSMDRKRHHPVLDQADEHSATIELGVRRSRLIRLARASGLRGAEDIVASMEARLGNVDTLSTTDLEEFEAMLVEAAEREEAA